MSPVEIPPKVSSMSIIIYYGINGEKAPHCRNSYKIESNTVETEAKSIPLTHIYLTAHFPGLVQALQHKVAWFN